MTPQVPIRGLIFDFDGLIVDTETAIYDAWRELYAAFDQELYLADYVRCVGSDFAQYNPQTVLEERLGTQVEWEPHLGKKDARIREWLEKQDTRPGVRELIADAVDAGLPRAVASSSSRNWVGGWLERLALAPHFPAILCRDDVARIKPEPDLFLAAAAALGIDPAEALVLEDSENGLHAAHAAGMRCVIVHNSITGGGTFPGALARFEGFPALGGLTRLLALAGS